MTNKEELKALIEEEEILSNALIDISKQINETAHTIAV
jgi:hypothetical protein